MITRAKAQTDSALQQVVSGKSTQCLNKRGQTSVAGQEGGFILACRSLDQALQSRRSKAGGIDPRYYIVLPKQSKKSVTDRSYLVPFLADELGVAHVLGHSRDRNVLPNIATGRTGRN